MSSSSMGPNVNPDSISSFLFGISSKSKFLIKTANIILISIKLICWPMQFLDPPEKGTN